MAPPAGISSGRGFTLFKGLVYTLLVINAGLLYAMASWREVTEQTGWLMILAAFEWNSRGLGHRSDGRRHHVPVTLELVGYALALFCWGAYAMAGEWQDLANATLWLLIAAALAYDLHVPGRYGSWAWRLRNATKAGLYLGVAGIALGWGLDGEWLELWDAMLWLVCFFVIELKIFDFENGLRLKTRR
ncbi:hypothetical protein [Polymorphobacter multimanifer]|uniref:hypothetical protein n=1 Tax=Polymorphobacter multimanifer TaxID=1070431 RepID=UPI00166F2A28|nr:hypothetical protein [Polymorphobacter multimanifer]